MDSTATDILNLYHEGLGLETHVISDSSFIARVGVVPYQQERLDAMIAQIKCKPSPQYLPRVASQGLYKPMSNPYEIRVLEIKPGTGMEKLEGALHHCSVEFNHTALEYRTRWAMSSTDYTKPICFTALSYTWGPPVFNGSIKCDGFVKKITKSLEAAIRQFRQPYESIMMWIDQICINQEDNKEKAQQIPLMSRIYTLSTSTVIWLGEASTGSASALKLLEQIVSCLQFTFSNPEFDDLERLGLPAADSKQWKYLCELLSRKWFTRVWIIQEAVLSAAESTYFSCGDSFTPWKTLANACMQLNTCGISRKLAERFSASLPSQASLGEAISNIENMKYRGDTSSIFSFLTATRYAECWDPKDRIYGLLGICNDKDRAAIRVTDSSDYTAVCLYQDVTAQFIRSDELSPWMKLPLVLGAVEHESSDLPSWAPDWRLPPSMTPLSAPLAFSGVYNACGRFSHINNRGKPMATIKGNELTTPGVFFDTIVNVSDAFVNPDLSYHNPMTENTALCTSVAFAQKIHHGPSKDATFEVLWKTLVAGKNGEGISKCPESFADIFSFLIDETTGKSLSLPGQSDWARHTRPKGKGRIELSSLGRKSLGQTFQQARTALRRAMRNRRLVITQKGYLGLFPGHVSVGDAVYVFDRCPTPFALRSVGSKGGFRFIGECFVHGIMDGEAVKMEHICLEDVTLV